MPQCCVVGCSERSDKKSAKNISFHGFPRREKSPKRYAAWVKKISRIDFVPKDQTVVCSKHFKNEDFEVSPIVVQNLEIKPKVALKKGAVPSQYLRGKQTVKKRYTRASKRVRQKRLQKLRKSRHLQVIDTKNKRWKKYLR
nr:PREDICTED: THAP domain-containing protein 4-like [Tribolium castaneum]|eukprot:XP_008196680.1 PREDICTED: THAP domain-containing protein 4-like [Tribolium castaneum]